MARGGSQSGVRSHRRGRRRQVVRRRLPVAPWIVVTTIVALVASGMVAGYAWLLGTGCSGDPVKATVAAPEAITNTLQSAAREWVRSEPDVDGQCIGVDIREQSSQDVVTALSTGSRGDVKKLPHVWVPESMAWLEMAKISDQGKQMLPDAPPLIATSPAVIAMPKPAAEALGWQFGGTPKKEAGKPSWSNLVRLAEESTWADFGKDEWGDITIGMSDPVVSTADLHALLSIVDANRSGRADSEELGNVSKLRGILAKETTSVDKMIDKVNDAGNDGKPVEFVSAFPALERDVWRNNTLGSPEVPLTAVYPADGSFDADHPFAVLKDVSWTDATHREIGRQFGEFLIGQGQSVIKPDGFRDGTRRDGSAELSNAEGLAAKIAEPQRGTVDSDSVQTTLATWQALARPANVLVVVDSSESMLTEESFDGKKQSRMDIVRESLQDSLGLFGAQANVGLWRYPYNPESGQAYEELASISEFDSDQQENIESGLKGVEPSSDGGLNDTVVAAYQNVLDNYNDFKGAVNLVLVISDGGEDSASGMSDADTTAELKKMSASNRDKNASVMTIGYGKDVDTKQLDSIASATQGHFYPAEWNDEINVQVLNALYYN